MPKAAVALTMVPEKVIIERKIYFLRTQKVMFDSDLAALYQVPTKSLNLAVRRNLERFPEDFMFRLTPKEFEELRFQNETSNRGGRRYAPYAFTEQGVAMLSSVLKGKRAVQVNIAIMRAFVKLREYLTTHKDLARELEELKTLANGHGLHIRKIYSIIEKLLQPPPEPIKPKRRIGFAHSG